MHWLRATNEKGNKRCEQKLSGSIIDNLINLIVPFAVLGPSDLQHASPNPCLVGFKVNKRTICKMVFLGK